MQNFSDLAQGNIIKLGIEWTGVKKLNGNRPFLETVRDRAKVSILLITN